MLHAMDGGWDGVERRSRKSRITRALGKATKARYEPPDAPAWTGDVIAMIVGTAMLVRGIDYLTGPTTFGPILAVVERYGSTREWGLWIATAAVTVLAAAVSRHLLARIVAHLFAGTVYTWYGLSLFQGVLDAGDGARFLSPVIAALALHGVCLELLGREVRRITGPAHLRRRRGDPQ